MQKSHYQGYRHCPTYKRRDPGIEDPGHFLWKFWTFFAETNDLLKFQWLFKTNPWFFYSNEQHVTKLKNNTNFCCLNLNQSMHYIRNYVSGHSQPQSVIPNLNCLLEALLSSSLLWWWVIVKLFSRSLPSIWDRGHGGH